MCSLDYMAAQNGIVFIEYNLLLGYGILKSYYYHLPKTS